VKRSRLLFIALLVVGCGGIPPTPPTQTVVLREQSDFGRFVLLIYDDSGLVQSASSAERPEAPSNPQATAAPERNEIALAWTGGACAHGPKLHITGDASALTLELDTKPFEFSVVVVDCPLIGLALGVTLTLSAPVAQDALTLTLLSR
jgi:hypothetical protein